MGEFILSKMAGLDGTKPLNVPLVIDIRDGAPPPAALQTFREKTNAQDPSNELWDFQPNLVMSGYYLIRSKKDGSYIVQTGAQWGDPLTTVAADQFQVSPESSFRFVQDPAGSGYCFIQCALTGLVITVEGASRQEGTGLHAWPLKSAGNDNQLWQAGFPSTVPLPTDLSFNGVGNASDFSFAVSVIIQRDGACHFFGNLINRVDAPQGFAVSMVVHDIMEAAYSFCQGGYALSGSNNPWDFTGSSQVIADNWGAIVCRGQASYGSANAVDPNTASTVMEVLMQNAATEAGAGALGGAPYPIFDLYPDTIYYGFGPIPPGTMSVNGGYFGNGGSGTEEGPPGWTQTTHGAT